MTPFLRRPLTLVLLATIGVVAVIVGVVAVGSSSKGSSGAGGSSAVELIAQVPTTVAADAAAPTATPAPTTTVPTGPYTTPDMPVKASASGTEGLASGDSVSVHVVPDGGSPLYGIEARLCTLSAPVRNDGEFLPTRGGLCIADPLIAGTDALVSVAGQPPYGSIDFGFRVGTGSTTFLTQAGAPSTVTCDASHPCQVVLKLQYPNGFGFQGVPVTFK